MEQLFTTFTETFARSAASPYNIAYAVVLALLLTEFRRDRPRLALTLAARLALSLATVWLLGTVSDMIFPNSITWTLLPAFACAALFHDWNPPVLLARTALLSCAWMYSIAVAEAVNAVHEGGVVLAAAVSLAYMLALWGILELLERRAPLYSRSMTLLLMAPVLVVCASGLAGRAILILRSDFGMGPFYSVNTLESLLTCVNGQLAELVTYGGMLHLVRELSEKERLVEEQHLRDTQLAGLRAYQESSESFHELRHEVKNQYAYIKMLLEQKDYERAEEFFGEMSMRANPTFAYVASGNRLVDDIVNLELSRARAVGVQINPRIAVPAELPYPETDLCSLLTNLLDNAVEASRGAGDKTIQLGMMADQGAFVVTVINPAARPPQWTKDGRLRTTKADGRRHGYGTAVVRKIAERYGGVADFSYADGVFTARVMLSLNCPGE